MAQATIPNRPAGNAARSIAQILANFDSILDFLNGQNLDPNNLSEALVNAKLGLSDSDTIRRGKSIIAGAGTRTNVAYGALDGGAAPGPDRIQNLVMPTDGLIAVLFQGLWQQSNVGAARAAIFIGANQLRVGGSGSSYPLVQEAQITNVGGNLNVDIPLTSDSRRGLIGGADNAVSSTAEVTTGQLVGQQVNTASDSSGNVGGPAFIFAAAGTYDVSIQFKASAGTVTVKNRKLWAWTIGF